MLTLDSVVSNGTVTSALSQLGLEKQSGQKLSDVKATFEREAPKLPAADPKQDLLQTLVAAFKQYVLGTFIEKYRPGYKADKAGVQTLTGTAFRRMGYEDKESAIKFYNAELMAIRELLEKSFKGEDNRLEYFDWLDFSENGVIKSSVAEAANAAGDIRAKGLNNAVVMGMGGSSMCAKLLNTAFDSAPGAMKIRTMDNMDPETLKSTLDQTNDKTAFVIISKSGGTFEAAHVIQGIITRLRKDNGGDLDKALRDFASRAVFITEPETYSYATLKGTKEGTNSGTLNKLAKELEQKTGIKPTMIKHPPRVGGRFSLFSPVGMFISELKGLKTQEFLKGAQQALEEFFNATKFANSSAVQYAVLDALAARKGEEFAARYVMPYTDRLSAVPEFTAQLAGESNNKDNVSALNQMWGRGPTAHHSDVEALCRNDKRKLLFEEILVRDNNADAVHTNTGLDALKDYQLKSMHQDSVTKLALPFGRHLSDRKNNPVVSTVLDSVNEKNMGYLMMRNMLATVIQSGIHNGITAKNLDRAVRQSEVEAFKVAKKTDAQDLGLQGIELQAA